MGVDTLLARRNSKRERRVASVAVIVNLASEVPAQLRDPSLNGRYFFTGAEPNILLLRQPQSNSAIVVIIAVHPLLLLRVFSSQVTFTLPSKALPGKHHQRVVTNAGEELCNFLTTMLGADSTAGNRLQSYIISRLKNQQEEQQGGGVESGERHCRP